MNSSAPHTPSSRQSPRRPATISELADRALDNLWDETKELKHYLRMAEKYRREGKVHADKGDLENAFVDFARAATLVLDKLPTHRDYNILLNPAQRNNLGLNGQDILESLSALKPTLVHHYDTWVAQHPDELESDRTPDSRKGQTTGRRGGAGRSQERTRSRTRDRETREQQVIADQVAKWSQDREETFRQEEAARQRGSGAAREPVYVDKRKEAAVAAARQAAASPVRAAPDYSFSRTPTQQQPIYGSQHTTVLSDGQRPDEGLRQHQQQQEEMRKREEEILRKREQKRRQEAEGIVRRQQEAEDTAHAVRQSLASSNSGATLSAASSVSSIASASPMFPHTTPSSAATTPSSSFYHTPASGVYSNPSVDPLPSSASSNVHAPNPKSRPPSFLSSFDAAPSIMPLESPTRYEGDSTDSESVNNPHHEYRRAGKSKQVVDNSRTPTRAPARSPSYPPPITTTSPPPGGPILYPQLMSPHQKKQGYFPSLNSMFTPPEQHSGNPNIPSSLLFVPEPQGSAVNGAAERSLYSHDLLPPASAPAQYPYSMQQQQQQQQQQQYPPPPPPPRHLPQPPVPPPPQPPSQYGQHLGYSGSSHPLPPPPATAPSSDRITRHPNPRVDPSPTLKTVNLPRECLPRFLAIAKVNTSMNRETCGLLLGKDKGSKFVVTTLLIPKQHSTSDTCTMDEEELVLQFTEERSLITLGWIHTHPSQSCFMSSVDLHTHSGFQRMLPESFAVVCAPKSNPNFGIFRLTDPPGLKTVLECTAKEAFHPHPDLPIYTDADKGHVQMRDIALEIVDLR